MKRLISFLLVLAVAITAGMALSGCGNKENQEGEGQTNPSEVQKDLKIGAILLGDENEGYTYAHIEGIRTAAAALNIPEDQIIFYYNIPESDECYDTAVKLVEAGCNLILSNSYGHQTYMQEVAETYKDEDITFIAMTGDTAKKSGLAHFKNAFTKIYESRYVSGVAAGMKIAELVKDGKLTDKNYDADGNVKIGYVGAHPFAEVVSGYTAFYLGVKSVFEDVVMEVSYTNSWFDIIEEGAAAEAMVSDGCVIIGQHADSTGAPAAVQALNQAGTVCYSVGYNISMLEVAPDAALVSATNNWAVYYEYAFGQMLKGEEIDTNWAEGYEKDAVRTTELGTACAEGTKEKIEEVEKALKEGTLHVFDTSKFTVGGETVTSAFATDTDGDFVNDADEAIIDGYYHESYFQAAPSFSLRIDGITELTKN
ncbi:MAG: BMP family ABC transporter substrate-binding protein [Clostridiales bacterium]|nr:BMP family ABC transporter substrate-binding protein [Clostridiales bacterium]